MNNREENENIGRKFLINKAGVLRLTRRSGGAKSYLVNFDFALHDSVAVKKRLRNLVRNKETCTFVK